MRCLRLTALDEATLAEHGAHVEVVLVHEVRGERLLGLPQFVHLDEVVLARVGGEAVDEAPGLVVAGRLLDRRRALDQLLAVWTGRRW